LDQRTPNRVPLLMTATFEPGGTPYLVLRDAAVRINQYLSSLLLWVERGPFEEIVFCENSGNGAPLAALTRWVAAHRKALEVLTFQGNDEAQRKGKGFGEGRIIAHAVRHSRSIQRAGGFYKVTGRLYVENSAEIVAMHATDANVFNPGDTRFFKAGVDLFARRLEPRLTEIDDLAWRAWEGHIASIEAVFLDELKACPPSEIQPFSVRPVVVGQSATDLALYDREYPSDIEPRVATLRSLIGG
jgi:hypothetical protein